MFSILGDVSLLICKVLRVTCNGMEIIRNIILSVHVMCGVVMGLLPGILAEY